MVGGVTIFLVVVECILADIQSGGWVSYEKNQTY
jgi:hypothetical protein